MTAIAIIGAGLAGLGLAHALLEAGVSAQTLEIFESRQPGAGASGLPAALMHPTPGRSLEPKPGYWQAYQFSQHWLNKLQNTNDTPLYQALSLLRPASTAQTLQRFQRSQARLSPELQQHIYPLSAQERADYSLFYHLPENNFMVQPAFQVWMPRLIQTLLHRLQRAGVKLRTEQVLELQPEEGGWRLETEVKRESFAQVILAPGEELPQWFPLLPLERIRGEVLRLRSAAFSKLPAALSSGGYLMPLGGEEALAGPTFYPWHEKREQTWSIAEIKAPLQSYLPEIEQAEVMQIWSGVRTLVRHDREPLVGPVPGSQGLFVFSAFATKGLLQMPWLAQALAQILLHQDADFPQIFHSSRLKQELWQLQTPCR
ncbi:hypothetical protein COW36_24660 [bacterium (Candidatus Blackallbacteria) CG17_big_fil_post_rev_8_21_14_2_50_48_46]|uniref:FAD dependent oxidoreductase domain-containing protein n=1 Tax=bacterium (Candidatus Blackallbacteria) CG17_big_fil_post_rev_8_21_14_2_50_48_46 TaxID=2014261 RepID=A0A2M7FXA3_9BACT|nr:MAG: hypothetical protein COW64_19600 [bacterium (Candidatus Blackallbacteria) CG18_big_fil_WC_8_21_14_2_50_49_26]PIW13861.1 MAG: hypothetical protein COW36_24660 [bacterium (Candidatus Blackallbacteria) CG17_big_fil_post_rev_8_21_14_2_50_48_46]PIW45087.1 MAG: hypothetical protein COW20_22290 [bacterium (Candidatus Blackallbacteria) CG13_big_fil_rev_8_21_14_2_50_49_14]